MNLPIKFPSDTEVILEEVARFQALTPEKRLRSIRGILNAGALILTAVAEGGLAKQYSEEQELLAQHITREFIARHAR